MMPTSVFYVQVSGPHGIALYDFAAQKSDELSFHVGDVVELLEKVNDNWLRGQNVNSKGIFPKDYIRIVIPLPETQSKVVYLCEQ